MRTSKELIVRGGQHRLEQLLPRVESLLRDGWRRDRQAEERLFGARGPCDYCFACTARDDRPAAGFWIHARGPNELYVSTIVPLEKQELTAEEHDRLLAEFEREFLHPAAAEVGVETLFVRRRPALEDELSPEILGLLKAFSASADRVRLQPGDRRRWNTFVVRAHQDESFFDPRRLDEWLQHEGWPEDARRQLLGEYDAARTLLAAYDEEAQRR